MRKAEREGQLRSVAHSRNADQLSKNANADDDRGHAGERRRNDERATHEAEEEAAFRVQTAQANDPLAVMCSSERDSRERVDLRALLVALPPSRSVARPSTFRWFFGRSGK